jgi:uncharacterized protein YecT (DUF1311 family)
MKRFWITFPLIFTTTSAVAADITPCFSLSTMEMSFCIKEAVHSAEQQLKQKEKFISAEIAVGTYARIPPESEEHQRLRVQVLKAFQEAQAQWLIFRDKDCEFIYQNEQYGSMRNVFQQQCLLLRTEERVLQLENWQKWRY